MDFIPAKCPSCGGDLMLPSGKEDAICTYCGNRFFLRDAIVKQSNPSIETLFKLAGNALNGSNYSEAYMYFTRIVELEPQNADAWIGKGMAAGWMSNLANQRMSEMLAAFSEGLELIPLENKSRRNYETRVSDIITQVAHAYYAIAFNHLNEFIRLGESTWIEFGRNVRFVLNAVDIAIFLNPKNVDAINLGIQSAKTLCEGMKYETYDSKFFTIWVSDEEEVQFLDKIRQYVGAMRVVQPDYQPPVIEKKKRECFIATATMGDSSHPYVVLLRKFRDEKLIGSFWGNGFVKTYYIASPPIARLIEKSNKLRTISLTFIIKPCVNFVKWFFENEGRT